MRFIADANVLLPLLIPDHPHHVAASEWWEQRDDEEVGLCLPVRLAVLRLLCNRQVMGGGVLEPEAAWAALEAVAAQPCVTLAEHVPASHALHWRANIVGREPTPNLWTDAWLAALAQSLDCGMATFDRGFRQFKKLQLVLLSSNP